jgi:protein SCO1/2
MAEPKASPDARVRIYAALALTVAVGFIAGLAWMRQSQQAADPFADCREGQVAGGAVGGPFSLVDESGQTVTDADVINGPTLVYFGFSFCPDVCPMDLDRNVAAVDILEEMGFEVTPVFVTFDPDRDTPEVMRDFTDNLHPRLLGLTGSADQVNGAMQAYRVYASRRDPEDGGYYVFDHSTFTYLMLPGTGFAEFFKRDLGPDEMAERVACFINAAS